jgi:hypothetical protein
MDEITNVIIYVTKDKDINIMNKYCRELEDLGFIYENKIELESLNYTIAKYSYHKNDYAEDIDKVLKLDDKINLEIETNYNILKK